MTEAEEAKERIRRSHEAFKLERRNPLPPGKYWQDIFEHQFKMFDAWLNLNKDHLDLLADEFFGPGDICDPGVLGSCTKRRWILFRVIEPVFWQGPGLPTIATEDIKTSEDTTGGPEPEAPTIEDAAKKIATTAAFGFGAIIAIGLIAQTLVGKVVGK